MKICRGGGDARTIPSPARPRNSAPGQPPRRKPAEQQNPRDEESECRSQPSPGRKTFSCCVKTPADGSGQPKGEEVEDGGFLAREHQRGAKSCERGGRSSVCFRRAPGGQNQSERGGDEQRFVDEIAVVIERQRREGEQQRGDKARDEAEQFHARAKQQDRGRSGENG